MICDYCKIKMITEGSPLYPHCSKCHSCFCSLQCFEKHDSWCFERMQEEGCKIHYFRCCDCNILKEENAQQPVFVPSPYAEMESMGVCSSCAERYKDIPDGM